MARLKPPLQNLLYSAFFSRRLKLSRGNAIGTDVKTQRFGNDHAAIRLLIILDDRNPGASDGEAAAIQGMHEFALSRAFRAITNVGTPSLKRLEVRARRYLTVESLARQPDFDVVGFRGREPQVSGTQDYRAVVQA